MRGSAASAAGRLDVLQLAAGTLPRRFPSPSRVCARLRARASVARARTPATDSRVARSSASLASLASRAISRAAAPPACVVRGGRLQLLGVEFGILRRAPREMASRRKSRLRTTLCEIEPPRGGKRRVARAVRARRRPRARRDGRDTRGRRVRVVCRRVRRRLERRTGSVRQPEVFQKRGARVRRKRRRRCARRRRRRRRRTPPRGRVSGPSRSRARAGGAATGLRRIASSVSIGFLSATSARTFATHSFASARVAATRKTSREASLSGSACLRSRHTHRPAYDLLPWKFTEDTNAP